jgi:hypothetical protein
MCCTGAASSFAELFVDGDARFAVVAEHADLDQAVCIRLARFLS